MVRRREYIGRLIVAGETRTMTGERGGYVVTAEAVRGAIEQGLFDGLACFSDHADGGPSVRRLVGVWHGVRWDEAAGAAVGRLMAYETAETRPVLDLLDQWLEERAGADGEAPSGATSSGETADLGVSLVFYPRLAADGRTVRGIVMVESADLVMFPASEGSRIVERRGQMAAINHSIQEIQPMKQETSENGLQRLALVRGAAEGDERPAAQDEAADWLETLKTAAATAVIRSSGLPAAVQERLGEGRYETAEDVYAAVERARGELAALSEAGVVRLGGTRPASLQLRDPLDEARGLMGFFFGAADGATPPPNMRSISDLYVALTGDVHFRGVFDADRVQFSAATTATLPNLAVDAMNRVVVEQFQALAHYRWYERIVSVAPNDGRLHDMKWITFGGIGDLPSVAEGAAYTEMGLSDTRESASFVKRGGYIGITREMIKNSDVMRLQAIPRALATAAIRSRSAAVSEIFTANAGVGPTLAQDSLALFESNTHKNLLTTALGSDATAWRAARAECFQHVEVESGKPLAVFPRFLLVPAELYDVALSILGYGDGMPTTYTPEAQDRGFADPRPIPLVVPDWTDATDWAYIVDPAVYPVIQMSYSQSPGGRTHPAPELFAVTSQTSGLLFTNDTLPIKVRDEFAVGVNGPRGIGKRNVSGS